MQRELKELDQELVDFLLPVRVIKILQLGEDRFNEMETVVLG